MPEIPWNDFAEMKHQISQERVIICGVKMRLKKFDVNGFINRLDTLDKRLELFEDKLYSLIEKYGNNNIVNKEE